MKFIGAIPLSSTLTETEWDNIVGGHAELNPTDSVQVTKPYSSETVTINAPGALALLVVDGREVGAIHWWREGNEIDVFGAREKISTIANTIAEAVNSTFAPLPESPPPRP